MIIFWISAACVLAAALGLVAIYAARPVPVVSDPARTVYRRQLAEIDDLSERGLLGEDERKSAYAEAARRLLGEGEPLVEEAPTPKGRLVVGVVAGAVALAAVVAYLIVGHPGMGDQPYKMRLKEWQQQNMEDLTPPQIVALLEEVKKETPNDAELLALLAEMQRRSGNPLAAQRNLEKALEIDKNNPDYLARLGEVEVDVAEGEVTPDARRTLEQALAIDPKSVIPRFLLAGDLIDRGQTQEGLAAWRAMLPDLTPEQQTFVNQRIAQVEQGGAGLPTTAQAVAADPQIMAMVQGLAARLEDQPDDPEGWARLVRSYGVIGDKAAQAKALAQAREVFKGRPRDLAPIEAEANLANNQQ